MMNKVKGKVIVRISRLIKIFSIAILLNQASFFPVFAQETITVRPKETDDILTNPDRRYPDKSRNWIYDISEIQRRYPESS
jgi:hypothetical protein